MDAVCVASRRDFHRHVPNVLEKNEECRVCVGPYHGADLANIVPSLHYLPIQVHFQVTKLLPLTVTHGLYRWGGQHSQQRETLINVFNFEKGTIY